MLVALDDASFAHAGNPVVEHASVQLDPGDRLGLIGRNGTGKTTLLRLLSGELEPDSGRALRQPGATIGQLRQQTTFSAPTLLDAALEPLADLIALEGRIAELAAAMHADPRAVDAYGHAQDLFERRGGYSAPARAKKVLSGLGFTDADFPKSVQALSGGEKNRLALARILLEDAPVLLLDEPTNHLDLEATEFLEEFLASDRSSRDRAVVVVSHDRHFLDRVALRTAILEARRLRIFPGGYSRAMALRQEQREQEAEAWEAQQAHIARTEDFIQRNLAGQNTKQAQSRRTQLEKVERLERPTEEGRAARMALKPVPPSEREVIAARDLRLVVGDRTLLDHGQLVVERGERIGLVGPNGSGKSTLLKTLLGRRKPDAGTVRLGGLVRPGYYDQDLRTVDPSHTVLEELRSTNVSSQDQILRAWAGRFLFRGDEALRPLSTMSGGEQARAALAKLTLSGANLLALDEPTNHLDAASREALEEALSGYDGTLVVVSHDRTFLDRLTQRTLWLDGARLESYPGPVTEALRARRRTTPSAAEVAAASPAQRDYEENKARERERRSRAKRLRAIDDELAALERHLDHLTAELALPENPEAWERLAELHRTKDQTEEKMLALMEERERLDAAVS